MAPNLPVFLNQPFYWSEHWQTHFGGEIHSLLATRPAFQQTRYNLIQYRFLNGPVGGDAAHDPGTGARACAAGSPARRDQGPGQEVSRTIWRVSLAGVDETGVVSIFSRTRFPDFVRQGQPSAPLPMDHMGELGDAWRYEWFWEGIDQEMAARIDRLCTPAGHLAYATSLWFEDVVGHRSTSQELVFV